MNAKETLKNNLLKKLDMIDSMKRVSSDPHTAKELDEMKFSILKELNEKNDPYQQNATTDQLYKMKAKINTPTFNDVKTVFENERQFINGIEISKEKVTDQDLPHYGINDELIEEVKEKVKQARRKSASFVASKVENIETQYPIQRKAYGTFSGTQYIGTDDDIYNKHVRNRESAWTFGVSGYSGPLGLSKPLELNTEEFKKYDPTRNNHTREELEFMNNINNII